MASERQTVRWHSLKRETRSWERIKRKGQQRGLEADELGGW
jgi:hypothetical protein